MKIFTRKVPLWGLLIALLVILCCAVQICAEIRFHSNQCSAFMRRFVTPADGISQNLSNFLLDTSTAEEADAALIGACLYAEQLDRLMYCVPRYTIFGSERGLLDELENSSSQPPSRTFSLVALQLREILNEYHETNALSEESLSTIRKISDAFSTFYDNLDGQNHISQKSFLNYLDILCTAIYP